MELANKLEELKQDDFTKEDLYLVIEGMDDLEIAKYKNEVKSRARKLNVSQALVDEMFKAAKKLIHQDELKWKAENRPAMAIDLEVNDKGVPAPTVENYTRIMRQDTYFNGIKFNLLTNTPEWHENNSIRNWQDVDDARARHHIEHNYGIANIQKYNDAIRLIFEERQYHPVKDLIESFEWDGIERIQEILPLFMRAEDNAYTREVSRLIFAGGIHRIYNPGCKFDEVPVLIGTKQGEGKSTFCRWLALEDRFFSEVNEIDGQKGMEAVEGGWICELSELLALTKAKEVEAVKSFITRQVDKYRKPYDKHTSEIPRQCIFIGTTNRIQFLTDKSGNRRFYPVEVKGTAHALYEQEEIIKHSIEQCWAEALVLYKQGKLQPYADPKLIDQIRRAQDSASEEDFREGMISEFLKEKHSTCVIHIWKGCVGDVFSKPTRKESNEIVQILTKLGWERGKRERWNDKDGTQIIWNKP